MDFLEIVLKIIPNLCRMLAHTYMQAFYTDWVHKIWHSTQIGYIFPHFWSFKYVPNLCRMLAHNFKFAPKLIPHWQDNAILYILDIYLLTCLIHLFEYSSAHAYFCLYISGSFFFKSTAIASKKMCSITLYLHDELVYYWESLS